MFEEVFLSGMPSTSSSREIGHVPLWRSAEAFVHVVGRLGSRVGDVIREGVQVDLAQLRLRGLRVVAQLLVHRLRRVRPLHLLYCLNIVLIEC